MFSSKYTLNVFLVVGFISSSIGEKWGSDNYDFVIIGGGTAGLVLANRLTEIHCKVLVLEAGSYPNTLAKIPFVASSISSNTWQYYTQYQNDTFWGLEGGKMLWSSGKILGGSSVNNYMIYTRGNPQDFDDWNLDEWTYDKTLPYFLKSELADLEYSQEGYHNTSGLMSVEYSFFSKKAISFLIAGRQMGYNLTDYNGEFQKGFSLVQSTLKKGVRQSIYDSYLTPVESRANLEIVTKAYVSRVVIKNNTARAVKFIKDGKKYRVRATKEIILSAGTFNTPNILMRSGIGPKEDLEELGITVFEDLPVGLNLQDHVIFPGLNFVTNSSRILEHLFADFPEWNVKARTWFSVSGYEALAFVNLTEEQPDVELLFTTYPLHKTSPSLQLGFKSFYNPVETFSISPVLLNPKSKGWMSLRSRKLRDTPILEPNFFSESEDMDLMIEAIKFVLNITETQEFRKINATLSTNIIPGCENLLDDEYWECSIRTLAVSTFDQFGTCKMGIDEQAVVGEDLKVKGIKNLRIVDASVIPERISGHLLATVVMIAEKAADFIKAEYNY